MTFNVYNLMKWVDEHRDRLKPPVGNQEVYPGGDFIVMVVGGPNERSDYHYNETAEFFYQIEGDMVLKIIENGEFKDVSIRQGDIYLLPPKTPHSPQRPAGTIGLVIEQKRDLSVHTDGFQWYCENCHATLHEHYFKLMDVSTQFPAIFQGFYDDTALHKCKNCGTEFKPPVKK